MATVHLLRLHRLKSKLSEDSGKLVIELVMLPRMQIKWRQRIDIWIWTVGVSSKVDYTPLTPLAGDKSPMGVDLRVRKVAASRDDQCGQQLCCSKERPEMS